MTRYGIFGVTALSLCLTIAPALAQQTIGGRNGARVNAGANVRAPNSNIGASQFANRGNAQIAQQRVYRNDQFRGDRDRGFGRGVGIAAGVAAGSALAYGGYGYGYDPYYYGDSYAYDAGAYYDEGYAVAPDVAVVDQPVAVDASYCVQRFRSYDPASGTYLGFDGLRHPCP
jgi:BA14K-like protein